MNKDDEKIVNAIEEDIEQMSGLVLDSIKAEVSSMKDDQLKYFEQGLQKETDTYLEKELSELRLYATTKASQDKLKAKHELLQLRQQMVNELFVKAEKKIQDFVKTDSYEAYLLEHLKDIHVSQSGYFVVKKEDVTLLKSLLQKCGVEENINIETSYFAYGGFRYVDQENHIEYSCDLTEKLNEAKEWFHNYSGFVVSKGEQK